MLVFSVNPDQIAFLTRRQETICEMVLMFHSFGKSRSETSMLCVWCVSVPLLPLPVNQTVFSKFCMNLCYWRLARQTQVFRFLTVGTKNMWDTQTNEVGMTLEPLHIVIQTNVIKKHNFFIEKLQLHET